VLSDLAETYEDWCDYPKKYSSLSRKNPQGLRTEFGSCRLMHPPSGSGCRVRAYTAQGDFLAEDPPGLARRRALVSRQNKPHKGPDSLFWIRNFTGKLPKSFLFCSRGEYGCISF